MYPPGDLLHVIGFSINSNSQQEDPLQPLNSRPACQEEGLYKNLGKVSEKLIGKKYGLLPNRGGGCPGVVKKPYCFFEEEKKYFFREYLESF